MPIIQTRRASVYENSGLPFKVLISLLLRFDPEKEIDVLEEKEKEARKKQQEKAKVMNENAVPSNLDLKGK